jgi:hypothetical protein
MQEVTEPYGSLQLPKTWSQNQRLKKMQKKESGSEGRQNSGNQTSKPSPKD